MKGIFSTILILFLSTVSIAQRVKLNDLNYSLYNNLARTKSYLNSRGFHYNSSRDEEGQGYISFALPDEAWDLTTIGQLYRNHIVYAVSCGTPVNSLYSYLIKQALSTGFTFVGQRSEGIGDNRRIIYTYKKGRLTLTGNVGMMDDLNKLYLSTVTLQDDILAERAGAL